MNRPKLLRVTTVPVSLNILLKGQLKFLNKYFNVIAVSGEGEDLQEVQKREGVRTVSANMKREISPLKDLFALLLLYHILRKERPDIVHSITPKAGLLSMLAGKAAGVPIRIHTFTGLVFPSRIGVMQKILIAMDRILCWAATNVYPEGEGVRQDLINYKITSKQLSVLGNGNVNGIDLQYFSPSAVRGQDAELLKRLLGICPEDFVFIFVGRLVGDKGINELITAFAEIVKEKKHVRLLLVGPTEADLDPLQGETLQEIEHNPDIISVGFQKDVRPYFAISDCLVFPSYREGFPNVVMQAGAMGLPAVVSDINGCNEIVIDGKNGRIVPPKNTRQLKQVMLEMMEDRILFQHLKSHARPMIQSRYEQSIVWNALLDEYRKLLNMQKS